MTTPSLPVVSRQSQVHPRLAETVRKHLARPWRRPVGAGARALFEALVGPRSDGPPWLLDAGCGTGLGTRGLALARPEALVLGVDKSAARLGRDPGGLPPNARLLRMDLEDFWMLAAEAGWRFERQYLLYPNPWPKPEQRLRRWPFHPVLPSIAACGAAWELRTNWKVYAEEFALAARLCGARSAEVEAWRPALPLTRFEAKYAASGHDLWRVEALF